MPSVGLEIWGKRAFFKKPGKWGCVNSYDFISPMICRSIFESIYWHPSLSYVFDEIRILNPIKYEKTLVENKNAWTIEDAKYSVMALCDVHYLILAHPRLNGKPAQNMSIAKAIGIFRRKAIKGYGTGIKIPYFGICASDFQVNFRWVDPNKDLSQFTGIHRSETPGIMIFDLHRVDGKPSRIWFYPEVKDGVISLKNIRVEQDGVEKIVNRNGDYR